MSEQGYRLQIVTRLGERCIAVPLQVKDSDKQSLRCMALSEYIEGLRIVTRLGERCIAVSLQVQGSDKTKLEVHGSVRARLKVMNITRLGERCMQCHCRCKTVTNEVRGAWHCQSTLKG